MKIDRIHYEELFPTGIYANQRLRIEATVDENDNTTECYQTLKTHVQQAFQALNPNLEEMKGTHVVPVQEEVVSTKPILRSREDVIAAHLITIGECETLRNLEMFANMVQRENDDRLYEAYNNKKKSLQ